MIRTLAAAATLILTAAFAGEASAQGWTHDGVAFPGRDNWCSKTAEQNDGSGGKTAALELRPCGQEFPFMSIAVAARGMEQLDIPSVTTEAVKSAGNAEGQALATDIFRRQDPACSKLTFEVLRDPVERVTGFEVYATYNCPALSSAPTTMRNLTAYAQRKNGDVWVVAFDHPLADYTEEDKAMIRSAVATIFAN